MARILIVDDEENIRKGLATFLGIHGHSTCTAASSAQALRAMESEHPDLVLLDVCLGSEQGLELLPALQEQDRDCPVLVISGQGDIQTAVQAIRAGAFDYLEKPVDSSHLPVIINNALAHRRLASTARNLSRTWEEEHLCAGTSPRFRQTLELVRRGGESKLNILLMGPNGTGKEVLARYAHLSSPRSGQPLQVVNCPAIPRELFESQLFGHRKGAFTGATADQQGMFARADGGTLFLDEIGDLPLDIQPKLLRAIEYGEIQALGSSSTIKVDVRIIAATNRDLEAMTHKGLFRMDLLYRLNQIPVTVPSLEERREDIPGLACWLLEHAEAQGPGQNATGSTLIDESGLAWLAGRYWPGNIRELRNFLHRALFLCDRRPLTAECFSGLTGLLGEQATGSPYATHGTHAPVPNRPDQVPGALQSSVAAELLGRDMPLQQARKLLEIRYLLARLEATGWSVKDTAKNLDMLPNNLYRRLKELEIELPRGSGTETPQ